MGRKQRKEVEYATPIERRMVERAIDTYANQKVIMSFAALLVLGIWSFKVTDFIENKNYLALILFFVLAIVTGIIQVTGLFVAHIDMPHVYFIEDGIITNKKNKKSKKKDKGNFLPTKYAIIENGGKKKKIKGNNILGYTMKRGDKIRIVWVRGLSRPFIIPDSK